MKSPIRFVLASALISSVMSSTPPARVMMSAGGSNPHEQVVGAAYVMTNEPTGNYVVSSTIGADGNLSLYEAVYTGGNGGRELPLPPVVDPLGSQGSIRVSPPRKLVANVNAGSNTATLFAIDPSNPARLSIIGKPVWSGGDFPISLAFNKAGTRLCVANAGRINGVSCYTVDVREGLTPLKSTIRSLKLNQTTPPVLTGPGNVPSQIIFSADESQLVVSVQAAFLAVWDINADGSLSSNFHSRPGGIAPFGLVSVPGKNAFIVADPAIGFDIFNPDSKLKNTTVSIPIANQEANCWSVHSNESGNFYVIDVTLSIITEVHVSSSLNSTIVKQYNLGNDGPIDTDVATVGQRDFMYVLAANVLGIDVLSVNGPGQAQIYQRIDLGGPEKAAHLPIHSTSLQGMATFIQ
ncbi:hypothetical protein C8R44DRAFT_667018 [Mycena epipterygia]|nr:hypothetical protein C8R44DRAFT_667018 [Mycena epipterygia]